MPLMFIYKDIGKKKSLHTKISSYAQQLQFNHWIILSHKNQNFDLHLFVGASHTSYLENPQPKPPFNVQDKKLTM